MPLLRAHRWILILALVLTVGGWVLYIEQGDRRIPWALALLAIGSIGVAYRWLFLENMMARASIILHDPHRDPRATARMHRTMDTALTSTEWRKTMHDTLNTPNGFRLYNDNGRAVLILTVQLPAHWEEHAYLKAAAGWIGVCMPPEVHCVRVDRNRTNLVYHFVLRTPGNSTHDEMRMLQRAVHDWGKTMSRLIHLPMTHVAVEMAASTDPQPSMEYVDVAPPLPPVDQTPVPPQDIFERKISLESESLTLYVGFNGSAYYTRFEANGVPRTYPSWDALWQIWKHFSEVQEAFPNS